MSGANRHLWPGGKHWNQKHGHCPGSGHTKTYASWRDAIARCYYPSNKRFARYGGRGITVCDRWRHDFSAFLADMGEQPQGLTLDRIDGNGNYEPGNCRWADRTSQSRNREYCKLNAEKAAIVRRLHADGLSLAKIALEVGASKSAIHFCVKGATWR